MSQPVRPSSESPATLVPVDDVDEDATVRHFDQLSERAQSVVVALVAGGSVPTYLSELSRGDVVVYTDYYRVQ